MNECARCHSTSEPAAIIRENGYTFAVCADCGEYTEVNDD